MAGYLGTKSVFLSTTAASVGGDATIGGDLTASGDLKVDTIVNQSGDNDSGIDLSTNDVVAFKTANTERMNIDASGRVTKPYQPSFRVGKSTITTGIQVVVFNTEHHDVGNNYNTSNGRFTCPIDGIYFFGWQGISSISSTSNEQNVSLILNGSSVNDTRFRGYTEQSGHIKSILNLSAGDYVEIKITNGNTQLFGQAFHNQFMGYLLG